MPMALVFAAIYAVGVVILAFTLIGTGSDPHYKTALELAANTRLAEIHLAAPPQLSAGDRLLLAGERRSLLGRYLRVNAAKGEKLDAASVAVWPELGDVQVTPVAFESEPDLKLYNRGTRAEISVGDENRQAIIAAVITSGGQWYALFPTQDLGDLAGKKDVKIARILSLPGPRTASPPPAGLPKSGTPDKM
jgi:hypothetical protein